MQEIPAVRQFMQHRVLVLYPDMDIFQAILQLIEHHVTGAPVVASPGDAGTLVGFLSEKDCLTILTNESYYSMPHRQVADYMSKNVTTVSPDTDMFSVATQFLERAYRRLPVVENGRMVGIVSRRDVLTASRGLWRTNQLSQPPDSGYLTENVKARLGSAGLARVRRKAE